VAPLARASASLPPRAEPRVLVHAVDLMTAVPKTSRPKVRLLDILGRLVDLGVITIINFLLRRLGLGI
jgi:hypothetical protein